MAPVMRGVPFGHVGGRGIEGAVGESVPVRRNPVLISDFIFYEDIAGGAVGDDFGFGDDARGAHAERLEDASIEKIAIGLAANFVDEKAEDGVAGVAVLPFFAGLEIEGKRGEPAEDFVIGELCVKRGEAAGSDVFIVSVIGEAGGVI